MTDTTDNNSETRTISPFLNILSTALYPQILQQIRRTSSKVFENEREYGVNSRLVYSQIKGHATVVIFKDTPENLTSIEIKK